MSRLSDSNPPPPVADFVSAPSGRLRSLSPPSLAAFPGNCSKPSQFPGAHSASQFVFSLIYKKKPCLFPARSNFKPTVRLEPPPTVADFVSAPSGHLRSLSVPSMAPFPENCSKPSQFSGAHSASLFKILCPLNKKTAHIFMHGAISEPTVGLEPAPFSRRLRVCSFRASSFAVAALPGGFSWKLLQAFAISRRSLR